MNILVPKRAGHVVSRNNWKQHVQRMYRSRIPRQMMTHRPKGKRSLGRPRKRWRETVTGHWSLIRVRKKNKKKWAGIWGTVTSYRNSLLDWTNIRSSSSSLNWSETWPDILRQLPTFWTFPGKGGGGWIDSLWIRRHCTGTALISRHCNFEGSAPPPQNLQSE
jgi:hypothetical protein